MAGTLLRSDSSDHPFALLQRGLFQLGVFCKLLQNVFHHATPFIHVSHFASTEDDGDLNFVFVLQKTNCLADLGFDVMLTRFGSQPNFFGFGLMSLLAGLLALFVLVFTEVHDSANGRLFIRRDFDQIQARITCAIECFVGGNNAILRSVRTNDPNWRNPNLTIYPSLYAISCRAPIVLNKKPL